MHKSLDKALVCVVGPTASGKTALAQIMAEQSGAAILSADSMQIYKGMDIGTGKIPRALRSVEYYGLDLVNPNQAYSAARFQEYGRAVVDNLTARGKRLIVCGGTGFYVRALIDDFSFPAGEQIDNPIRNYYSAMLSSEGPEAVWKELRNRDAASAEVIPVNDSKRVIRALEMLAEGISYAEQKKRFSQIEAYYPVCMIGLEVKPEVLAMRINSRVDEMMREGLLDEVRSLLQAGYRDALTAMQAIGYKEFIAYLDGACSFSEAVEQVKLATRRYAKRQRTWFRKDKRIVWLDANNGCNEALVESACSLAGIGGTRR